MLSFGDQVTPVGRRTLVVVHEGRLVTLDRRIPAAAVEHGRDALAVIPA